MRRLHVVTVVVALALNGLVAGAARAQGFGLYEQNACAMGRGGAAVASPCDDGSAIFFNPGALAAPTGAVLLIGGTVVQPRGKFVNDATDVETKLNKLSVVLPHLYFAKTLSRKITAGLGVFSPYGLETNWPERFEGRFLGFKSKIQGAYIQPTVAFRPNDRVSIGGGVDVSVYKLELQQHADLSTVQIPGAPAGFTFAAFGVPPGTDFASVDLEGDDVGFGFHVGVQAKPSETVSVGVRYLSRQTLKITTGEVQIAQIPTGLRLPVPLAGLPAGTPIDPILATQFAPGARLSTQTARTEVPLPDQFVAGIAVAPNSRLGIFADYQWVNWSLFDTIEIVGENGLTRTLPEDYGNTNGIRLGVEYAVNPGVVLRGGFVANSAGAPDQSVTPNLPEAPRKQYSFGSGFRLTDAVWIDAYYLRLQQDERAGRTSDGGLERPTAALNNGVYGFHANLLGLTATVKF